MDGRPVTRYRNAPSMSLRPADTVLPRSKIEPTEYGVSCLTMVASFAVFAALVAMILLAMALA